MNSLALMAVHMACQKRTSRVGKSAPSTDAAVSLKAPAGFADSNPLLACAVDARSLTKQLHRRGR